jgi:hypothetical protein
MVVGLRSKKLTGSEANTVVATGDKNNSFGDSHGSSLAGRAVTEVEIRVQWENEEFGNGDYHLRRDHLYEIKSQTTRT